jgi:hypothetical protein
LGPKPQNPKTPKPQNPKTPELLFQTPLPINYNIYLFYISSQIKSWRQKSTVPIIVDAKEQAKLEFDKKYLQCKDECSCLKMTGPRVLLKCSHEICINCAAKSVRRAAIKQEEAQLEGGEKMIIHEKEIIEAKKDKEEDKVKPMEEIKEEKEQLIEKDKELLESPPLIPPGDLEEGIITNEIADKSAEATFIAPRLTKKALKKLDQLTNQQYIYGNKNFYLPLQIPSSMINLDVEVVFSNLDKQLMDKLGASDQELSKKELVKQVQLPNYDGRILLEDVLARLNAKGYPLFENFMFFYYSVKQNIFIYCGRIPSNEPDQQVITLNEIGEKLLLKYRRTQPIVPIAPDKKKQPGKWKEKNNGRRTKDRKIGDISVKIIEWRKLCSGVLNADRMVAEYSVDEAAKRVGIVKKAQRIVSWINIENLSIQGIKA